MPDPLSPPDVAAATARADGYSWDDINQHMASATSSALADGYSQAEVDQFLGKSPEASTPAPAPAPSVAAAFPGMDTVAEGIRAFAQKYLTPSSEDPNYKPPQIKTAGDFFKALGWSVVDVGKFFGRPVVDAAAATFEGLDGKPRTRWEMEKLGAEAQGFLGMFAGASPGIAGLVAHLPPKEAFLDGAAGLASMHPDGITPATLTDHAAMLGQHFVDTGEHPVTAAARVQSDSDVLEAAMGPSKDAQALQAAMKRTLRPGETRPAMGPNALSGLSGGDVLDLAMGRYNPPVPKDVETGLTAEGINTPIPGEAHLLSIPDGVGSLPKSLLPPPEGLSGLTGDLLGSESGAVPLPSIGQPLDIQPSTLFKRDPVTANALAGNLRAMFNPQSLAPEAAGIIRSNLAQGAVANMRRAYNLQRFGRAVGELSSADRAAWRDAVETGNAERFEGTPLGTMARQMRVEKDALWDKMDALDIAPAYVENHLTRFWENPEAASAFFGNRPLAGTQKFTRARVYELTSEGLAAGLKLKSDNPVDMEILGGMDQQRFIDAASILKEMKESGLVFSVEPAEMVPDGLSQIPPNMFRRADPDRGRLYVDSNTARLLERHTSASALAGPVYDSFRKLSSAGIGLKVAIDMFHPVLLTKAAMAMQVGSAVKLIVGGVAKGSLADVARGLGKGATAPVAFARAITTGRELTRMARTGEGSEETGNLLNAMIQGGMRFGADPAYSLTSTGAGGFWRAIHGMVDPSTGLATVPQELAQMFRDAGPITVMGHPVAPGYIRALGAVIPRVLSTISEPLMKYAVPALKTAISAEKMQEAMRAHPNMGLHELRMVAGRISDETDNIAGEMVQQNLSWNATTTDVSRLFANFPTWVYGKLRAIGGTAADTFVHGGTQLDAAGRREMSDHLANMVGIVASAAFTSMVYGYLSGTYKPSWSWKDYMYPMNALGTRVSVPGVEHYVYNWLAHPEQTASRQLNWIPQMLDELGNNRQFDGAAIHDPHAPLIEQFGEYSEYFFHQLAPLIVSTSRAANVHLTVLEKALNISGAPYEFRQEAKERANQERSEKTAVSKMHKDERK